MPSLVNDPGAAPRPPVARPKRWPPLLATALALGAVAGRRFDAAAVLAGGTVLAGFFFGRRVRGSWLGLALAAMAGGAFVAHPVDTQLAAAIFFALSAAWWALRFRDDRAPANGLVALATLAAFGWLLAR